MKKVFLFFILNIPTLLYAQNFTPEGYTYQGIARNAQGGVLTNQNLPVRISIISGTSSGNLEYEETHSITTNQFGLFTLTVGQGTQTGGAVAFNNIAWGATAHFMKVEIDFGTGYINLGTTQIWSVPYALHAKHATVADSVIGQSSGGGLPAGVIVMWSGNPSNIPSGWALCDGTNGTPDLRGRFVVGYDANATDYNTIGNTGGQVINAHTHSVTINPPSQNFTTTIPNSPVDGVGNLSASPGDASELVHSHTVSVDLNAVNATSSQASDTENRPPYYVLAYIVKL